MGKMSYVFAFIAIVLSNIMCCVVAYNYRDILCGIEHAGYSGPASLAFIYAIPYLTCIAICIVLAFVFKKK